MTSDSRIVTVNRDKGLIIGNAPGRASIQASIGRVSATTTVAVRNQDGDVSIRFNPDVVSILTTKGCNGSGCHGSPAGQNGFKLSLFGYDTAADYEMIVKAAGGKRVNLQAPEESLFLKKPSFRTPHGGGRVLPADSEEYQTIRNWLAQGASLQSGGTRLTGLELYPPEQILAGSGSQQRLAVIGRLSDGSTRDMTREVRYSVKDDGVVSVSSEGVVTAGSNGWTAVIARGMGQVAAGPLGVVSRQSTAQLQPAESTNFVDRLVFSKMRRMGIEPHLFRIRQRFAWRTCRRVFSIAWPPGNPINSS